MCHVETHCGINHLPVFALIYPRTRVSGARVIDGIGHIDGLVTDSLSDQYLAHCENIYAPVKSFSRHYERHRAGECESDYAVHGGYDLTIHEITRQMRRHGD